MIYYNVQLFAVIYTYQRLSFTGHLPAPEDNSVNKQREFRARRNCMCNRKFVDTPHMWHN